MASPYAAAPNPSGRRRPTGHVPRDGRSEAARRGTSSGRAGSKSVQTPVPPSRRTPPSVFQPQQPLGDRPPDADTKFGAPLAAVAAEVRETSSPCRPQSTLGDDIHCFDNCSPDMRLSMLESRMQQQNYELWHSSAKKDSAIQIEQEEYRSLLERFNQAAADISLQGRAEERGSAAVEEAAKAKEELCAINDETQARSERHDVDVDALTKQLSAALASIEEIEQIRSREAEELTKREQAIHSSLLGELAFDGRKSNAARQECVALANTEAKLRQEANRYREHASACEEQIADVEKHAKEVMAVAAQEAQEFKLDVNKVESLDEQEVVELGRDLEAKAGEIRSWEEAAQKSAMELDEMQGTEAEELAALRGALQMENAESKSIQESTQRAEQTLRELLSTKAGLEQLEQELARIEQETLEAERTEEVEAIVADEAERAGNLSRRQAAEALDQRAAVDARLAVLATEAAASGETGLSRAEVDLQTTLESSAEIASIELSAIKNLESQQHSTEEALHCRQAVEERASCALKVSSEALVALQREITSTSQSLSLLRFDLHELKELHALMDTLQQSEQQRASELASTTQSTGQHDLLAMQEEVAKMNAAAEQLAYIEEQTSLELRGEMQACVAAQTKVSQLNSQLVRLQETDRSQHSHHEDLLQELAVAKADAMRNSSAASEYRAELAVRRRKDHELRGRNAAQEQQTGELQQAGAQLRGLTAAHQRTEADLRQSKDREEFLEQQLRLAMQRLRERSHASGDFSQP